MLLPSGVAGVYGRGAVFEAGSLPLVDALDIGGSTNVARERVGFRR